jgi:hypothetical protein
MTNRELVICENVGEGIMDASKGRAGWVGRGEINRMAVGRNELVERNTASLERMRAFADRLTDNELSRPLGNGWTAAAELAHVAFWDRRATVLLDRWARDGVSASDADVDAINDAMLPQWLLLAPRAAVADALAAGQEVNDKVAALSPELEGAIVDGQVVRLNRAHHRATHLDVLERRFS